jgi:rod shape-determining protein MreC
MTALLATRAARRRGIAFATLLVISLLLMAFSSNPALREVQGGIGFAFRPIQGALDDVAGGAASIATALVEIDRLRVDNDALRLENERLTNENAQVGEIRRENELLTGLLQLRAGFEYETAAAHVIARDPSEFRRMITIDKGEDVGITVGDVVVGSGGALAGRVVDVGPASASVVLLNDASSTVIGQLVSSAETGEVVGQLGGVLVMQQIDSSADITLGDEVVTAGIELGGGVRSPYPKGLLLGQVIDVRRDANDVVQTAYLQPAADLDRLEFVLVVLDYEGGLPPLGEQPVDCGDDDTLPEGEQPCFTPTTPPTPPPSPSPAR